MLIFAAIGAFGLLFLLVMLFFGGGHDLHIGDMDGGHDVSHAADGEGGPSIFSSRIIASFISAFGFGGTIGRYLEFGYPASSAFGIVSGVVLASVVFKFAEILYSQQASSEVKMTSLVGMTAEVAIADSRRPSRPDLALGCRRAVDAHRPVARREGHSAGHVGRDSRTPRGLCRG